MLHATLDEKKDKWLIPNKIFNENTKGLDDKDHLYTGY